MNFLRSQGYLNFLEETKGDILNNFPDTGMHFRCFDYFTSFFTFVSFFVSLFIFFSVSLSLWIIIQTLSPIFLFPSFDLHVSGIMVSVARILLAFCMVFTFPMECFVTRHCFLSIIEKILSDRNSSQIDHSEDNKELSLNGVEMFWLIGSFW